MDFLKSKDMIYWIMAGAVLWWIAQLRKSTALPGALYEPFPSLPSGSKNIEESAETVPAGFKTIVSEPNSNSRTIMQSTIDLVKSLEGLSLTPYKDAGGYSVGYGHFLGNEPGPKITREKAEQYLLADLGIAAKVINEAVRVKLSRNQFDALVSLVFNIGSSNFRKSTLLKRLNSGDYTEAAQQFRVWINSGGQQNVGLIRRRKTERELFEKG